MILVLLAGVALPVAALPDMPDGASSTDAVRTDSPNFAPPQPFAMQELLRFDYRGLSPITRRSLMVTPVAPLSLYSGMSGAVLFQYRSDVLDSALTDALSLQDQLHRFELGVPAAFRLSEDVSLDVDLRAVYASNLDEHRSSGWYPSIRVGPTWKINDDLSLGGAVFWTRGALGFIPVPLGTVYWRPQHGRFRVDALIPRYVEAAARVSERIEAFATFHWESLVWAIQRPETDRSTFLIRQEVRLHAGLRFAVLGPLGIEAAGQWVPVQSANIDGGPSRTFTGGDDFAVTVSIVLDRILAARGSNRSPDLNQ